MRFSTVKVVLFFMVKDNGKIIGQEVSDNTKRSIAEAVNRIEPFVELEISVCSYSCRLTNM